MCNIIYVVPIIILTKIIYLSGKIHRTYMGIILLNDYPSILPYSAIVRQGKILVKSLSQRIGGEIFGECCSK